MKALQGSVLILIAFGLIVLSQSLFIVDESEQALVFQLGRTVGEGDEIIKRPGLHFKLPLIQEVKRYDRRILSIDTEPKQMVVASNQQKFSDPDAEIDIDATPKTLDDISGEPIVVDVFTRYKIVDPLQFYNTLGTINDAQTRIEGIVNDATRNVLGKTTLLELLSSSRTAVMNDILQRVNKKTKDDNLGIDVVDIRIVRADLTPALRQSTVKRMISELRERATETRAKGEEQALRIRSTAEKERTVILAEAGRDAQIQRGMGDNTAIETYANAFNQDKDFYEFLRSMEAYDNTLTDPNTRMILSPDNHFLRFLNEGQ